MVNPTIFVAGSDTEVGKTWVAARLIAELAQRGPVAARKPVQSFEEGDGETDAELLARASGEHPHSVCPPHRWYSLPLAPPIAAERLGKPLWTVADLASETTPANGIMVIEGVGGPLSPLADDGDSVALARALAANLVVLVTGAGLGAINAALAGVRSFEGFDLVVFLNRFDPDDVTHETNRAWLTQRAGLEVAVDIAALTETFERRRHTLAPQQPTVEVK